MITFNILVKKEYVFPFNLEKFKFFWQNKIIMFVSLLFILWINNTTNSLGIGITVDESNFIAFFLYFILQNGSIKNNNNNI